MGERRKRKSMWDMEEESRHASRMNDHSSWTGKDRHSSHGSGRYHEFSDPRTTSTRQSRDHSDWPPWESFEENPSAQISSSFKNAPEGTEMAGGKRYYQKMSPGFDGMEPRGYNHHTREYDRSHSQRGRTRGRSRSRSSSRGRERGRGWSRSRSRSRSRSDLNAKDHIMSRSPISDYRHQSQGWSDRRSGPEKPSQICRDFSSGSCRRGSQCRFFHPNSTNRRDAHMEVDRGESWRGRGEDQGRIPKHSYSRNSGFESRHDVSDSYNGEDDERYLNKSRNSVPCKDFVRGNCRWGESCRFSHHISSDNSFRQSSRNESFDNDDFDLQNYRNEKPLCKFFAAGKCGRDNCRFSHVDAKLNKTLEARRGEISDKHTSHDNNSWNGPTWDDAMVMSDAPKPTGWESWDATVVTEKTSCGNAGNGQTDDGESKNREILEYTSSLQRENGGYGGDTGPTESISEDNTADKQELPILQNQDGIANVHIQNALLEYQKFSLKSLQQNAYPSSAVTENNERNSLRADGLDELKATTIHTTLPILLSGESLNEAGEGKNMLGLNTSSGFSTDLDGPLNVQIQTKNNQTAAQSPLAFLEPRASQFPTNLTQVPLVNTNNVQLNQDAVSLDPFSSNGNGRDNTENENHPLTAVVTEFDVSKVEHRGSPRPRQEEVIVNSEVTGGNKVICEESKGVEDNNKVEDGSGIKDEKGMRLFKNALVEFVKEILKPIWKEGKMSREVHKTVVKKVVEKVSSTIQVDRIPKTQDKIEQYLSSSKPKITKLIQAYVERCPKADS